MPEMSSYPPGVPNWIDLATPDPDASKQFYGELFGWEYQDEPTDQPGVVYTMARRNGLDAAGMMLLSPEMAAAGMPPVWSSYINVDDLDAAVGRVQTAGGQVVQSPMDVMDSGRMAVIVDPTGASVGLWEAKAHIGCRIVNEHGALGWNELTTPDPAAAADFYGTVVGWTAQTMPMPSGEYTVFHVEGGNENGIAGAMTPQAPGIPPSWGVYFTVDDTASVVARATELGAQALFGPEAMPGVGTLATLADPQGAIFSLLGPES